eukprot:1370199-Prymnesium_polylepis.1
MPPSRQSSQNQRQRHGAHHATIEAIGGAHRALTSNSRQTGATHTPATYSRSALPAALGWAGPL